MSTEEIRRDTGDPFSWGGNDPTQAPRGGEAVRAGVGEVHSSEEAGNDRGAKGPQFRVKAKVVRRRNIDENLLHRINLGSRRRFVCRNEGGRATAFHRGQRLDSLSESRDAVNLHVGFDERDLETERSDCHRGRSRLYRERKSRFHFWEMMICRYTKGEGTSTSANSGAHASYVPMTITQMSVLPA
jgi:hypothetical protein